jgi:DNA ligase 1
MTKTWPTLFKRTSTGKIEQWTIRVLGTAILTEHGQVGGKLQTAKDVIGSGKNVGRANETTSEEQAILEADAKWIKSLKKGYVKTVEAALAGEVDDIVEGGIVPMLAKTYSKDGDKIKFPAFVQPKFDGHRTVCVVENGVATLWSRTRKPITGLPHIIAAVEKLGLENAVLDGEAYNHDYKDNFEDLTSFIRTPDPKPGHEVVQYHIYDTANEDIFSKRQAFLDSLNLKEPLVPVLTLQVNDEDEMMLAFDNFLKMGYEGLMIRNANGLYVNKRSADLQKVKEFLDDEFKVIDVEPGRGKMADKAIFVCETKDGVQFRVKMKGSLDELKKFVVHPALAIGKLLTVQYQGMTGKKGVPRFPVGLRLREEV